MKTSEKIDKLAPALFKAQQEMGNAKKDSNNPFFKSKYADLNAVREAVMPALAANGFAVLQPTTSENSKNYVETVLLHESGQWASSLTEIKEVRGNNPQDNGAGTTYARRFALQSFMNCGAEDDDGESSAKVLREQTKAATKPAPAVETKAVPEHSVQEAVKPTTGSFRTAKKTAETTPVESVASGSKW